MKGIVGRLQATFAYLFEFKEYGDAIRVTTALLLPSGDYVVLYVRRSQEGGYEVADNGETIRSIGNIHLAIPLKY